MSKLSLTVCLVVGFLAGSCQSTAGGSSVPTASPLFQGPSGAPQVLPDLPVAHSPFLSVEVSWKQRIAQGYVFLEARGSYTKIGAMLEELHARMDELGLAASGPPFGLYYDDPGEVPIDQLRMRACFPVDDAESPPPPLAYDVLSSTTCVYAFIGGAYPEVPRAYPALYAFMDELGWVENGPIREVYLVNPAEVQGYDELVAEVQIPATSGS